MNSASEKQKYLDMVKKNPSSFVLKPQSEGGAHNYYNDSIIQVLEACPYSEVKNYILMEKIDSISNFSLMLKDNGVYPIQS